MERVIALSCYHGNSCDVINILKVMPLQLGITWSESVMLGSKFRSVDE